MLNGARIAYLDGMRGVAILSVVAWHYTNRDYVDFFPYRDLYASIPVLAHGWVGVNLFFLISGYVILLTLERCTRFRTFLARRWLRLFPAMLVASLLIFGVSRVLHGFMPHGRPDAVNLLPGLTFLIPPVWETILRRPIGELDGVFWTLYVEMGFYVIFGLLYFRFGWRNGLIALTALWLAVLAMDALSRAADWHQVQAAVAVVQWFGTAYFGWFVSGALFRRAHESGSRRLLALAVGVGTVSAFTSGLWQPADLVSSLFLAGCVLFFAVAQISPEVQRILAARPLLWVGAISYPLYLLHNEIGIGLIKSAPAWLPERAWPALPVMTMGIMLSAAWIVTRWLEPVVRALLRTLLVNPPRTRTG